MDILETLGTWLLVILGWIVVSDQQEARELAKNMHLRLNELRGDLVLIEEMAIEHHTTAFDDKLVNSLIREIGDFSTEVSHLKRCGFLGLGTTMEVTTLRQSITRRNMDSSEYERKDMTSDLVAEIQERRASLDRDLLTASHRALTNKRPLRTSLKSLFGRL